MPVFQKLLKMKVIDDDVEDFMMSMVKQTIEHREKNNVTRKDLFQLLIQLRNTGNVQKDGDWETKIQKDGNDNKEAFLIILLIFSLYNSTRRIWQAINI